MSALLQDLRYAARALSRQPGFTAAVVLTLALGMAATTIVFGVVHAVLVRPLRFPDSSSLVMVLSEFHQDGATSRVPAAFPG
ncbi:MAG TPA: permease, partial [Vicinamibacteria bacterium]|nr:permease [Vicinamibacteria bacterium]